MSWPDEEPEAYYSLDAERAAEDLLGGEASSSSLEHAARILYLVQEWAALFDRAPTDVERERADRVLEMAYDFLSSPGEWEPALFGRPGRKPGTTDARRRFLRLVGEHDGVMHEQSGHERRAIAGRFVTTAGAIDYRLGELDQDAVQQQLERLIPGRDPAGPKAVSWSAVASSLSASVGAFGDDSGPKAIGTFARLEKTLQREFASERQAAEEAERKRAAAGEPSW